MFGGAVRSGGGDDSNSVNEGTGGDEKEPGAKCLPLPRNI